MTTATWIAIVLLTPFWWGLGLFILAWLGDVSPPLRPRGNRPGCIDDRRGNVPMIDVV